MPPELSHELAANRVTMAHLSEFTAFIMILKRLFLALLVLILAVAAYFAVLFNWSYSTGERAGWVQKLSNKGWVCKTWEGELALVSLPGSVTVEKFYFTVRDARVATEISRAMGKRVTLHYEEKVGLPTSCFGDTRYFVTRITDTGESPPAPGAAIQPAPVGVAPAASGR